jgi:hypothetical protein
VLAKIFMLDFVFPAFAPQDASLASGNFQSLQEFLLSIHRLEGDKGVDGLRVMRFFVLLYFL